MLLRAALIVATFLLAYWVLGSFAFMRIRGLPQTVRWCLSALVALTAGGVLQIVR